MKQPAAGEQGRIALALVLLFLVALVPRMYSAQTLGWDWDRPGSFTLINFDEAGSCRAALDGFSYSPFVGQQTIAVATAMGAVPPPGIVGDHRAVKAYCHSAGHILVARGYSAVLGALTVVALVLLALQLQPGRPAVAWTAGGLLALSGFHISESQSGTVDAPSVFFIYAFFAALVWAVRRREAGAMVMAILLMVAAIWAKYWVFAAFAWLALLPRSWWDFLSQGFSPGRIVALVLVFSVYLAALTNVVFPRWGLLPLLGIYLALVPWQRVPRAMAVAWLLLPLALGAASQLDLINAYTQSGEAGRFGTSYAAIGENKWLRNLLNIPFMLLVGLGIPACIFLPRGVVQLWRDEAQRRLWVSLLPVLAFLLFMAFLAPVTYYRHYLPLLPAAALLAALGLHSTPWGRRPWFLALFFAWPALLAWDLVSDYHQDPRIELRQWYAQHADKKVFASYYVSPPRSRTQLFKPDFAFGDAAALRQADYLILSENWYDTAFANELNGPRVSDLEKLVKTRPAYARFYRQALAGEHPLLREELALDLVHLMPELLLHRHFYGNFQLFVGDLKVFRVQR